MRLSVDQCLAAIERHTHGLADAASGRLDARVEHCPDWSVGDLVWHLTEVHTFWEYVARERPSEPEDRPASERPSDDALVDLMLERMRALLGTLRDADQDAGCWTWGLEEDVRFITRHQVQEAAVHHWDAVNATGQGVWEMDELAAADAVDEFLTHSVANRRWPNADAEPLGEPFGFAGPEAWRLLDGEPGTLRFDHALVPGSAVATPADILLWLYRRTPSEQSSFPDEDDALVRRFRAFTSTD